MTQRTVAHLCTWLMILAGILFALNIFIVPYFAEMLADTGMELSVIAQFILNLSQFTIQHTWFWAPFYAIFFFVAIVWYRAAKPAPKET